MIVAVEAVTTGLVLALLTNVAAPMVAELMVDVVVGVGAVMAADLVVGVGVVMVADLMVAAVPKVDIVVEMGAVVMVGYRLGAADCRRNSLQMSRQSCYCSNTNVVEQ